MNKPLFKSVPQLQGAAANGETVFEFLQRGGRAEAIEIRQWLENWFREYPEDHGDELSKRLQSKNCAEFMGAYFELQVFSVLHRLGCDVEIHPYFEGTHGKVDFGVTYAENSFYLEATVCGIEQGILRSNANEEDAIQKIKDAIPCPHSDVWLDAEGELLKTLGSHRLVGPVQDLLDSYSPNAVPGLYEVHPFHRPRTMIQEGNWKLEMSLVRPIASDGRGQIRGPGRGGPVDGASPIARALRKKAEDWTGKRRDDAIFIIAVNVCHSEYSSGDELTAIYGSLDPVVGQNRFSRPLSRIAGVIVIGNAILGQERGAPVRLYENPDRGIPECLQFLQKETSFGELIGLA
ncbi:MAG: hypothetical protein OXK72_04990 [Gammaproteobacteria bacterium]|nr:hypothetical protein [Gammaproteobacteria bacterium]MDE0412675.1 hypothetical protein [Gammaproteobacteria bacterium]